MIDSTMTLADGRELAYAELGEPTGPLVFYFHGAPGSRLEVAGMDEDFARNSVRVVSPERPGCGRSSPQPGRRRSDWARDVAALADHLGHRQFAVCGMSSGGPYAVACAALLPDRVVAAAVVAGVTDVAWPGFFDEYEKAWPDLVELMGCRDEAAGKAWCDRHFGADGVGFPGQAPPMGRADRSFLRDPARAEPFLGSMRESFRQGTGGFAHEKMLEGQPWEFDPAIITAPTRVLHGETDGMCPIGHSRHTAEMIPSAALEVMPEHGHLSIMTELPAIAASLAVRLR